jgi:hypothetical protein
LPLLAGAAKKKKKKDISNLISIIFGGCS